MSVGQFPQPAVGTPGAASPPQGLLVGGSDGTNLRAALVDTSGRPVVQEPNNNLLAPTTESITTTVTSITETAAAHGRCVVVTLKNANASTAWAFVPCVRIRNTTNGMSTNWQTAGFVSATNYAQLYFNVPVTNGDSVVIDIIAPGTVGASAVSVAAVLSPLEMGSVPLRADGRSYPVGSYAVSWDGAGNNGTRISAPGVGWKILVHSVTPPSEFNNASSHAYALQATLNGATINLCPVVAPAANVVGTAWAFLPVGGILLDANTAVSVGTSTGTTNGLAGLIFYDVVPS